MTNVDTDAAEQLAFELDEIIEELDTAGHELPIAAIRRARELPELIVPRLIEVLQTAASEARDGITPEGQAPFFALYLLTELKAKKALPALLELLSLPGNLPFAFFGDSITEDLARVLVTLGSDEEQLLDELIENCELNEYVRWEAAQAFWYLVRDGRLTREQAVERLGNHLRHLIESNDAVMASDLVDVLAHFAPIELRDMIADAYEKNLVDSSLMRLEDVERWIEGGPAMMQAYLDKLKPTTIDDSIAELSVWASFREKPPRPVLPQPQFPPPASPPAADDVLSALLRPLNSGARRVGRNQPCPCGSGKKFKKCCGAS